MYEVKLSLCCCCCCCCCNCCCATIWLICCWDSGIPIGGIKRKECDRIQYNSKQKEKLSLVFFSSKISVSCSKLHYHLNESSAMTLIYGRFSEKSVSIWIFFRILVFILALLMTFYCDLFILFLFLVWAYTYVGIVFNSKRLPLHVTWFWWWVMLSTTITSIEVFFLGRSRASVLNFKQRRRALIQNSYAVIA